MTSTPLNDHQKIQDWLARSGMTYVDFSFDGDSDKKSYQSLAELPEDIREAGLRLTEAIISSEIREDWAEGDGAAGFVRYTPGQAPWLDADDEEEDWVYERECDIDDLEYEMAAPAGMEP